MIIRKNDIKKPISLKRYPLRTIIIIVGIGVSNNKNSKNNITIIL
jgi:hypothetical protein